MSLFQRENINASAYYLNGKLVNFGIGAQGKQGAQGNTGAQGMHGSAANQGAQGKQGEQGAQGPTGAQGNTGNDLKLPTGAIVMWYGSTPIPDKWYICDGTNGTPDLRGKFVLGAGAQGLTYGSSGGSFKIEKNNLPEHTHNNTLSDPGHIHRYKVVDVVQTAGVIPGGVPGTYWQEFQDSESAKTNIALKNSTNTTTHVDYHPPYYVLYYIMFKG